VELFDGTIVDSNLTFSTVVENYAGMFGKLRLQVGQVVEVIPIDDQRNRSGKFQEYNVLVTESQVTTAKYRNCKYIDSFGSENNFQEAVLNPITDGKRGQKGDNERMIFKNGSIVIIGCIEGNKEGATILGCLQHPGINLERLTSNVVKFAGTGSSSSRDDRLQELPTLNPGVRKKDGQRVLGEYNGIRWNINKEGELTIVFQGIKDCKGAIIDPAPQPTVLKFNKDGEFFVIDNLDQEIKISRKDQKILISSGNNPADFIEIDRANQNITTQMSKDEIHTIGQDKRVTIDRDELEDIKGASTTNIGKTKTNVISKDHIESVAGTWRVKTGGEVVFSYPTMKLGSDGASEPVILGTTYDTYNTSVIVATINALRDQMTTLIATFNAHTHAYDRATGATAPANTGGSNSTGPSGPSAATSAPASAFSKKTTAE